MYQSISDELVFKGGTALQKAYALGRFSEDLNFTANVSIPKNITNVIRKIEVIFNGLNDFYNTSFSKTINAESISYELKIKGPLFKKPQSIQTILIKISMREKLLAVPDAMPIIPIYKDLGNYIVKIMNAEEILAEKIRTMMTRRKATDLFDLYFLFGKGIRLNMNLVDKKLSYCGIRYNKKILLQRISSLERVWKKELEILTRTVPDFGIVHEHVLNRIK